MTIDAHWPQLAGAGLVARHQEPSADLEDELVEMGRTLADRCLATFDALVRARTTDERLIAAAYRGRLRALEQIEATPDRAAHLVRYECSTHGTAGATHRILRDHPLENVFSVGDQSSPEVQELAAEVVGFRIGEQVRVALTRPAKGSGPRFEAKTGTVKTINPADREVGVMLTKSHDTSVAWFCPAELVAVAHGVQVATGGQEAPQTPAVADGARTALVEVS